MSLTLILMRHAKSSWSTPAQGDHDRPLNGRGTRNAHALGRWLRHKALTPDQILCSTARRTRDTLSGLDLSAPVDFDRGLYLAEPDQMLDRLRRATGQVVAMIAHNPGTAELAEMMVQRAPDHARFDDYPTGATLVVRFDASLWSEIGRHSGQPIYFVIPRELPED
ncbi:MAG: histidine phosphatase family protein [Sedimentitalea sp.]